MRCKTNSSSLSILLSPLLVLILASNVVSLSSSCQPETCGSKKIPYPFGIQEGCYLNEWYKIECRNATFPFLSKLRMEVVNIYLPGAGASITQNSYGSVNVRVAITSVGCSSDGKDSNRSLLNLTDSPFFIGGGNSLIAIGYNSNASLTNIEPSIVGCELREEERSSSGGNGFCRASLPDDTDTRQMMGVSIESFNNESQKCRVAFLTSEDYSSEEIEPERLYANGYATVWIRWVIQTKKFSYINSLGCKNSNEFTSLSTEFQYRTSCLCNNINISGTNYATCGCNYGYEGNPYLSNGCEDVDECLLPRNDATMLGQSCGKSKNCVNVPGSFDCVRDKTREKMVTVMIGLGASFGPLFLLGGIWFLRKFLIKRKITLRKKKFFKHNGGLLLQQQLDTNKGIIEKTRVFTSSELEKATENFSKDRILGQGGQGTVYKGMLVDGKTVAVKKSKAVDEDKLEEFINEVVILSQVNHRHVVKLWGCCLETEVPVLVYEFIPNGNLFQHIHEESDDYTMIWGVRLRIAVDIAGALSYLHSAANSPIYHRDVKSTNILLDEKYRAKVSDFGTSRTVTVDHTHWTTLISGTVGYVDPEYYGSSQYTDKSDVYSFGVILVELITGEKPVITIPDSQEIRGLADHFRAAMKENKFFDIMDARIRDACKPEQVMAVANLARRCLNSKGKKRPYMREVFTELERISSSPEDSLVKNESGDGDGEEEEGMDMLEISDSWTIAVTAPATSIVPSSSTSDVEPLFLRTTL